MFNKKLIIGIFVVILMTAPFTTKAVSTQELQAQISQLLALVASLQQQLAQKTAGDNNVTLLSQQQCENFTHDLYIGKRDSNTNGEVSKLQRFLIREGVYPEALVTGYYGILTAQAVMRWQHANGMTFTNLQSGVGPKTRAKIRLTSLCNIKKIKNEESLTPIITSVIPNVATIGTKITLYGKNFASFEGNKTIYIVNEQGEKAIINGAYNEATQALYPKGQAGFVLKSKMCKIMNWYSGLPCTEYMYIIPGKYQLYVSTYTKDSNRIELIVKEATALNGTRINDINIMNMPTHMVSLLGNGPGTLSDFAISIPTAASLRKESTGSNSIKIFNPSTKANEDLLSIYLYPIAKNKINDLKKYIKTIAKSYALQKMQQEGDISNLDKILVDTLLEEMFKTSQIIYYPNNIKAEFSALDLSDIGGEGIMYTFATFDDDPNNIMLITLEFSDSNVIKTRNEAQAFVDRILKSMIWKG